jgi:hypothetical protein
MAIMREGYDSTLWLAVTLILSALAILMTWYVVIVGRDRKPARQRRGEETVERYGDIGEDRAPVPRFLYWTYIGTAVWSVAYLLWTGVHGLGY